MYWEERRVSLGNMTVLLFVASAHEKEMSVMCCAPLPQSLTGVPVIRAQLCKSHCVDLSSCY